MNRYSIIVKADKLKGIIPIPSEFEHKEVEVVISLPRKKKFDPRRFRGVWSETKAEIDREIKAMRGDWDRNDK